MRTETHLSKSVVCENVLAKNVMYSEETNNIYLDELDCGGGPKGFIFIAFKKTILNVD